MAEQSNKANILVIDDSVINIELISDILSENYEIIFATSAEKANKILENFKPDLILLDIVMPVTDGLEFIKMLKGNPQTKQIPVIFITAKSTTQDMVKGFKLGAVDYISKPFSPEEVSVRVKTQIDNQLLLKALKTANEQLEKQNRIDGLTNIANRRYFDEFLHQMINRAKRQQQALSLVIIDIDFFKLYNDNYGHQQGDSCLIEVANKINEFALRDGELAARYGGEEFAIILSAMDAEKAIEHTKKCLQAIEELKIKHDKSKCNDFVTISMGIVTETGDKMTPDSMIKKADSALYKAKEMGRNQLQQY